MPKTKWIIGGRQRGKSWMERMYLEGPMPNEIDVNDLRGWWTALKHNAVDPRIRELVMRFDGDALLNEIERLKIQYDGCAFAQGELLRRAETAEAEVSALKAELNHLKAFPQIGAALERDALKAQVVELKECHRLMVDSICGNDYGEAKQAAGERIRRLEVERDELKDKLAQNNAAHAAEVETLLDQIKRADGFAAERAMRLEKVRAKAEWEAAYRGPDAKADRIDVASRILAILEGQS